MMSGYPDNWETMGARARHEWGVRQRKLQAQPATAKAATQVGKNPQTSLQEQYFYYSTMIKSDEQSLKSIPDHLERDKRKPALLNKYREYLEEYLSANETHDNNVLFYCMVWACDVEQWGWAVRLCDYAVITQQKNDVFRRSHAEIVADAVFWRCEKIFKFGAKLPDVWRDIFDRVNGKQWTIDDALLSRYLKLEGDIIKDTEPQTALAYFKKADSLNPTIGVKGRIKALEA